MWAQRISYAGELGWELYGQFAMGDRAWGLLWEAGSDHGLVRRARVLRHAEAGEGLSVLGQDIHTEHDPVRRPGSASRSRWTRRVPGARRSSARGAAPARSSPVSRSTIRPRRARQGADPIGWAVVGYVTSAGYGYSVGRCIVYGYLPAELAVPGTAVEVEYFDERLPATSPRTRSGTRRAND